MKKISLLMAFLLISSQNIMSYPDNSLISDGSDIIHHEVKKTETIVAEIIVNKKSSGTVDLSITDSFSTESKNFSLEKNKVWLTLSGAKFKEKTGVIGTVWNIDEDGEATSYPIMKIIPKDGYDMKIKGTSLEIKFTYK